MKSWNPRYVEYARAHDVTPVQMRALDQAHWPGGRNAGFILWMNERWNEFCKKHGLKRHASGPGETNDYLDQDKFDEWLPGRVDELLKEG